MDTKELELKELSVSEAKETNGGGWVIFVGSTLLGGLLCDIVFHPGETLESFNRGREEANRMNRMKH